MRGVCMGLALIGLCGPAQAAPLDTMYDDQELAAAQASYERGWRNNYQNVFLPRFTADEKARFAPVQFVMERRVAGREPFGFVYRVDRDQVVAQRSGQDRGSTATKRPRAIVRSRALSSLFVRARSPRRFSRSCAMTAGSAS